MHQVFLEFQIMSTSSLQETIPGRKPKTSIASLCGALPKRLACVRPSVHIISSNSHSRTAPCVTQRDTEALRSWVTCSKSHLLSSSVVEMGPAGKSHAVSPASQTLHNNNGCHLMTACPERYGGHRDSIPFYGKGNEGAEMCGNLLRVTKLKSEGYIRFCRSRGEVWETISI